MIDPTNQVHVDLKTMTSMLLGITYQELHKCIEFTVLPTSNQHVFWNAAFTKDSLGIKLSLSDIDFNFDTTQSMQSTSGTSLSFHTKNAALRHILFKLIMIVKPNIINEWMDKSGNRPIIVHENCHGKLCNKVEYKDGVRTSQRSGLHGWFVIFEQRKKIYGCDISLMDFDDNGRCSIKAQNQKHVHCFSS